MRRRAWPLLAVGLGIVLGTGLGWTEIRLARLEGRARSARAAADWLEAQETRPLERAVAALDASTRERERQAASLEQGLRSLQRDLAQAWRGDHGAMRQMAQRGKVPQDLLPSLEEAQKVGGEATLESRFGEAVNSDALADVAAILEGWEERSGYTAPRQPATEEPPPACERARPGLDCARFGESRWLCRSTEPSRAYVLQGVDEALEVTRLVPVPRGEVRFEREMGAWWVLRTQLAEPAEARSDDDGTRVRSPSWYGLHRVEKGIATERVAVAAQRGGHEVALLPVDLDGDGTDELVSAGPDFARALRLHPASGELTTWGQDYTCERLLLRGTAPQIALTRAACAPPGVDGGAVR